ncbi:hypothetical protein D3C85_1532080 [compost metagenome]
MQHAVSTEANAKGAFVRFEVQVRRSTADGIQQHLVNEAHHRSIVCIDAARGVILVFIACLNVNAI